MHGHLGKSILLALCALSATAYAQVSDDAQCGRTLPACTALRTSCCTRTFDSVAAQKAILIPTDTCHQPFTNSVPNGGADVGDAAPKWCASSPAKQVNAQTYVFGLVYRLMQNKIPVYWIANPTKAPTTRGNITPTSAAASTKDVDMWILTSTGTPPTPAGSLTAAAGVVTQLSVSNVGLGSMTYGTAATYARNEFPIRGSAFIIAPEDRAKFDTFMKTSLGRSTCGSGNDCYDFINNNGLFLWEIQPGAKFVWQDYSQPLSGGKYVENANSVPVAMRIDYRPPTVAVVGSSMMNTILADANLDDIESTAGCKTGTFTLTKPVGCALDEADVVTSNRLVTTVFDNVWVDLPSPASCVNFSTKLQLFATSIFGSQTGGNIVMFGDSITVGEQCTGNQGALLGLPGTGLTMYGSSVNDSDATPLLIHSPSNLLAQYGDLPLNFASGSVKAWDRVSGTTSLYNANYTTTGSSTLRRLMSQEVVGTNCSNHNDTMVDSAASTAGCDSSANNTTTADYRDIFAYGRYLDNSKHGVIYYSPGNNPSTDPTKSHLRLILGTMLAVPAFIRDQVFNNIEVSRASPIIASVGGASSVVQGTYEYRYKTDGVDQFVVPRTVPGVALADDVDRFSFPYLVGHVRAKSTASLSTTASDLSAGTSTLHASTGEGTTATPIDTVDTFPAVVNAGCNQGSSGYTGTCRAVWTTVATGFKPANQVVGDTNTTVSTLMLPESAFAATNPTTSRTYRADFVRKILRGYETAGAGVCSFSGAACTGTCTAGTGTCDAPQLGGIDRSTVAVIGPGATAGAGRATIAYVGGTDGMVHAICVTAAGGGCTRVGMELWAYIPRVNLPLLRYNLARVDGSARVLDILSISLSGLKTVLLIQAGRDATTSGSTPAIYALDITNPQKPSVLWEYATFDTASTGAPKTPTTRPVNGLGIGLTLAAGQVPIASVTRNILIAQTNNGGTGSNGNYIIAIDIETGAKIWDRFNAYPSTTISAGLYNGRTQPAINIPATAIPPGVTPIDKTAAGANGFMTDIVAPDLFGNVWLLDPATGLTRTHDGSSAEIPLFQYSTNYHPLTKAAIFSEGTQYAVMGTGGYADYSTEPLWGANVVGSHYLIAVDLNATAVTTPLYEGSSAANIPIKQAITGFAYSQPTVVGTQVFITSDTANVNLPTFGSSTSDTGYVAGYDLVGNTAVVNLAQVRTGASSLASDGTTIIASSGGKRQQVMNSSTSVAFATTGPTTGERTVGPNQTTKMIRKLWLRTE